MQPKLRPLAAVLFLVAATLGCAVSQDEAEQADIDIAGLPVEVRVTATRLAEDYEANEIAANQKYDGKVLNITGTVAAVSGGQDGGAYYVDLSAGNFQLVTVRCYFAESRLNEFIAISKGDRVALKGKGDEGENRDPFTIDVVGCRLSTPPQAPAIATPVPNFTPTPTLTATPTPTLTATPTPTLTATPTPTLTATPTPTATLVPTFTPTPTPTPVPTATLSPTFTPTPTPTPVNRT